MRSIAGSVLAGAAGAALPSAFAERVTDDYTLIPSRLDRPCWRAMMPFLAPNVRSLAAFGPDGLRYLVAVGDGLSPAGAALQRPVTIPSGVSTVRLVLEQVALQSGQSSTGDLTIELRDATGTTVVASATYTPTATSTNVYTSAVAVTSTTEYIVRLCCNETGQSRFVCGEFRLEPVEAEPFWLNVRRIDVSEESLHDSVETGHENPRYVRQNQFAHVDIETDARAIVVEAYDSINDYVINKGYFGVFVDGYPLASVPTTYGRINHAEVALPSGGRRIKKVSVWNGPQATTGLPAPANDNRGTFLAAIYVPKSAYVDVIPESAHAAGRVIATINDSKGSGYYSDNPGIDSMTPMLRLSGIKVISLGAGGESLSRLTGGAISEDACLPLAKKLLRKRPDEVVLQIGRNDFANNMMSAANLTSQLGNLADAIHSLDPRVLVTFMTFSREVTETAKGGVSWDTMRDNIIGLTSTRSGWTRVVNAGEFWTSTDVATYVSSDTVHVSSAGQEKKARGIIEGHAFSLMQLSNLFALYEFDRHLPGGAPGAVTSDGLTPPTISLSGTATVTGTLRIEMKVAGQRGAARFRWGIDGLGWIGHNVLTAASVPLPGLGISVAFPTGSYANNVVYTAPLSISQVNDLSGNGRHATAVVGQRPMYEAVAIGGKPAALFSSSTMRVTGISLVAPYTIFALGQMGSNASRAIVGKAGTAAGALMYCNAAGDTFHYNDGTFQRNAAAVMTNPNLFIVRVNGASSSIRVNGTQTSTTLNNTTLTGFYIGTDNGAFAWDKWIKRVGVCSSAISDGECRALEALCRAEGLIP